MQAQDAGGQADVGRRVIWTLTAANFFLFFGAGAQQQYLVSYLGDLTGWSGTVRASVQAGVYFSMMVFRLVNVWLLRRWSDRTQTIVGSFTYTLFCAAMMGLFFGPRGAFVFGRLAVDQAYVFALVSALFWGWGGAALWAGSSLQILAATDAGKRQYGTGIGILYSSTHAGFMLGVVALGWLYGALPEAQLYLLYVVATAVTFGGNVVLLTTPRLGHVAPEVPSLSALAKVLGKAKAQIAGFLQLTSALSFGLMLGAYGDLIKAPYGKEWIWILAAPYPAARLVWSLVSGVLSDRLGRATVLAGAFLLASLSLVWCAASSHRAAIGLAAAALGLLGAAVPVVASAIVGDSADRQRRPLAYGSIFAFRDAGVVIAAMGGQVLRERFGGFQTVFFAFAIVFLICGVISVVLQRWAEQRL
jgi:MFS family permease